MTTPLVKNISPAPLWMLQCLIRPCPPQLADMSLCFLWSAAFERSELKAGRGLPTSPIKRTNRYYTNRHTHTYTRMLHTYVHVTYVYTCIYTYINAYIHTHIHTHTHTHTHTHRSASTPSASEKTLQSKNFPSRAAEGEWLSKKSYTDQ
jgi:hypothetical protein